jgi:hypothetical protein
VSFLDAYDRVRKLEPLFKYLGVPVGVEWDIRLTTTNDYKTEMRKDESCRDNTSEEDRRNLLLMEHPRFMWRATAHWRRVPFVELLLDATDIPRSTPVYRILWYQPDLTKPHAQEVFEQDELQRFLSSKTTPEFAQVLAASLR